MTTNLAVSANTSVSWITPTSTTGSGSLTQGSSLTIPAGSTCTFKLTTVGDVNQWSLSIQSDNAYINGFSQAAAGQQQITFSLPLAPSVVRVAVKAAGMDTGLDQIFATIVYDNSDLVTVNWGGDLTTSNNNDQWVSSISGANGAGGTINVSPTAWTWPATTAAVANNVTFTMPTSSNANATGGSAIIQLQAPTGAGTEAFLVLQSGSTLVGSIGYSNFSGGSLTFWQPGTTPNDNNGSIYIGAGTTQVGGSVVEFNCSSSAVWGISGTYYLKFTSSALSPNTDLQLPLGTSALRFSDAYIQLGIFAGTNVVAANTSGVNFTIQAESANANGNANGGQIVLQVGAGVGTGAQGFLSIQGPTLYSSANSHGTLAPVNVNTFLAVQVNSTVFKVALYSF